MKSVKLNLLIAVGLVLLLFAPSQSQFVKTLGGASGEDGRSVVQTSDGGFVAAGWTDSFGAGGGDLLLSKFDASGNHVWSRTLGGTSADGGYSVIQTSDSGLVVTGRTDSFGAGGGDLYLSKFDASGNHVWSRTLGGTSVEHGFSVVQTSDGGLVVTGYTQSFGAGSADFLLSKFDAFGNWLWSRTLGGSSGEVGHSVVQTSDGGFVVTGNTTSFGAGAFDLLLSRFDASGTHLWSRTLGGTSADAGYSVVQTSDGGFVVTGNTGSFGAGNGDLLLSKFDASGNPLWSRTLGTTLAEYGYSVVQTSDGGLVVTGVTGSFGYYDLLLSKFDASGNHLWSRTLGGTSDDDGYSVVQTSDGGLVVTGYTGSFGVGGDLLLSKFDFSGNTCLGQSITPTVMSISPTITIPPVIFGPCSPTIKIPNDTVTSPTPMTTTVCENPGIFSVSDVGNDQGKQVRVKWNRCSWDSVGSSVTITEYSLWRRVGQYKGNLSDQGFVTKEMESIDNMFENVANSKYGDRYLVTKTGDLWDFIATIPAMQFSEYSYVAPTLVDSSYKDSIYYWSVFFISAHTPDPLIHFDSDPDSGYSLDNIPPLPIRDLEVNPNSWFTLQWIVPGEYVGEHPISTYDVRYNTVPVGQDTQAWWDSATACTTGEGFFNFIVGETDSLKVVKDCGCHPVVYFAIKGLDDRPNASGISNIVQFKCGDANGDGGLSAADVVYLINYLFIGGPPPVPMAVGDVNCDGKISAADVVYLINYLFINGPKPCSP